MQSLTSFSFAPYSLKNEISFSFWLALDILRLLQMLVLPMISLIRLLEVCLNCFFSISLSVECKSDAFWSYLYLDSSASNLDWRMRVYIFISLELVYCGVGCSSENIVRISLRFILDDNTFRNAFVASSFMLFIYSFCYGRRVGG